MRYCDRSAGAHIKNLSPNQKNLGDTLGTLGTNRKKLKKNWGHWGHVGDTFGDTIKSKKIYINQNNNNNNNNKK